MKKEIHLEMNVSLSSKSILEEVVYYTIILTE